jgi:hypothetical protein
MPHKDPETAKAWRRNWWKTAHKARSDQNAAARRRHEEINTFLRRHKMISGCADCGFRRHHAALEFHHEGGDKEINLSFAKSLEQARREMAKCAVLCSNCHRIRHWNQAHTCKPDIFAATYEAEPSERATNRN